MGEATSDYLVKSFPRVVAVAIGFIAFAAAMDLAVLGAPLRRLGLLARGCDGRSVRHDGRRRASTSARHPLRRVERVLRPSPGSDLRGLVPDRANALDPTASTRPVASCSTGRRSLATFALGTAVGDMTASTFHLGYPRLRPAVHRSDRTSSARLPVPRNESDLHLLFAYVLTRPLGASFADWLDKARYLRGLALGTGSWRSPRRW